MPNNPNKEQPLKTKNLVRDRKSNALLSRDLAGKRAYEKKVERQRQLDNLIDEVENLKSRLNILEQTINVR